MPSVNADALILHWSSSFTVLTWLLLCQMLFSNQQEDTKLDIRTLDTQVCTAVLYIPVPPLQSDHTLRDNARQITNHPPRSRCKTTSTMLKHTGVGASALWISNLHTSQVASTIHSRTEPWLNNLLHMYTKLTKESKDVLHNSAGCRSVLLVIDDSVQSMPDQPSHLLNQTNPRDTALLPMLAAQGS